MDSYTQFYPPLSIMKFSKRSASHALNRSRQRLHELTSIKRNQSNYFQLELNLSQSRKSHTPQQDLIEGKLQLTYFVSLFNTLLA